MSKTKAKPARKSAPAVKGGLDVAAVRAEFPLLAQRAHGKPLVYLDNAATTQKPRAVIEAVDHYYREANANIHRGVYALSQRATDLYEGARRTVQRFINAPDWRQIIYTSGTTQSINLVASTYGRTHIKTGDQIILTGMEHHSNIVPWQMLCAQTGGVLGVVPFDDRGDLILEEYEKLLRRPTKLVSIVHVSNALGTVNPVKQMIRMAHAAGVPVMVDAAQAVAHLPTDVQADDVDFLAFSGHKIFGPTGIGILYAKAALLQAMPPYQGGGDMISSVTFEKTTYNEVPYKFEAGTPHIAGGVGLGAAITYARSLGLDKIAAHEDELLRYAHEQLAPIAGLRIVGTSKHKVGVVSFVLDGIHPHDVGTVLDGQGIAIRTGHHCCQPVMDRLGIAATARASLAAYNTKEEIDALAEGIRRVIAFFA